MRVAVIPAYDEERTIGSVVLKAQDHVDEKGDRRDPVVDRTG